MPKPTRDYSAEPDYLEAVEGKKRGINPVFFGTRTYKGRGSKPRYSKALARELTKDDSLDQYYEDIDKKGTKSEYWGCVLYPERHNHRDGRKDQPEWTYEKNKAFWAGIIDSSQELLLVTDITHYDFLTGTVDELLWLADNNYSFSPNPSNPLQTIARPPNSPKLNPEIKNYENGQGNEADQKIMFERLKTIKTDILAERKLLVRAMKI